MIEKYETIECAKCFKSLHLINEMEWPDGNMPIMCWECQHDVIGNMAILIRRLSASLKKQDSQDSLLDKAGYYLEKNGFTYSILRQAKCRR